MIRFNKLLLLLTLIPLASCYDTSVTAQQPSAPQRLYLTQKLDTVAGSSAYIILDTKTNSEYLVVENTSRGIAIIALPIRNNSGAKNEVP